MVILWSVQPEPVAEILRNSGRLTGDGRRVRHYLRPAYRWMIEHLSNRVPRPSHCRFPIWAWERFSGPRRKRPDLRRSGILPPRGTKGILIEYECADSAVLLSDIDKWYAVIRRRYLPLTMSEALAFERKLDLAGVANTWPYPEPFHTKVVSSWKRVFDVDAPATDCWLGPEEREVQAVVWELKLENVRSFIPFISR